MIAGAVEIQMLADLARLKADMDQAKGIAGAAAKSMQASFDFMKGALQGIVAGLSVHAFVSWMKGAIDAGDATKEFAAITGVAAKDVAGLQLAFAQGNVGRDEMTKGLAKLSKQMVEGNAAFDQLGIKTRNADGTLRSTKATLYDVADAFAAMKDGPAKTAYAMELFGKSGADMIATLNEGSAGMREMAEMAEKLGLVIDEDAAEAADKFNDTTQLLGMGLQGVARQTMAQLLPTLNSLAGGFLTAMTQGDALSQTAGVLAAGMKGVYTVIAVVVQGVNTLGKSLGAVAGQLVALATGNFREMIRIGDEWVADIKGDWTSTIKSIGTVWDGSAGQSVAAMAKVTKAQTEAKTLTKGQEEATKRHAAEVQKLTEKLAGQIAAQDLVLAQGEKLTPMQKQALDLMVQLRDGTLRLTDAEKHRLTQQLETILANERWIATQESEAKLQDEITKDRDAALAAMHKETQSLADAAEKQREQNLELQLGAAGYAALQVQRLLDTAAQLEQTAATSDQSAELREQARLLRERASLLQDGVVLKEAKAAADEWAKTTDQIGQGLTDSLFRAFESGKGFFQTFWDGIKNLFKTTVLKLGIQYVMTGTGLSGLLSSALAATGGAGAGAGGGLSSLGGLGSLGGMLGNFGPGFNAGLSGLFGESGMGGVFSAGSTALGAGNISGGLGTLAGGASGMAGGILAGMGIGKAIGGAYSIGGNSSLATGIGSAIGMIWGPIGSAIGGAIGGLVNRAFGRTGHQTQSAGISGTIAGGDVAAKSYTDWLSKGGWFRSDKRGTDYAALSGEQTASLQTASAAVYTQTREWAKALKLPAESLAKVSYDLRIQLGADEKANAEAISAAFSAYQDKLAGQFKGLLAPFQKAGESLAQTMARLAELQSFSATLNQFGGIFSRIAGASIDARENIISLAGGIEALAQKSQQFVADYYSEGERAGLQAAAIGDALRAAGIDAAGLGSREQFRALVEAQDVSTAQGRQQLVALLDLAPQFAQLADYLTAQGKTLDEAAQSAPQVAMLQQILEQPNPTTDAVVSIGDQITGAVADLKASTEAGLAAIAAATAANTRLLDSWDGGGYMLSAGP